MLFCCFQIITNLGRLLVGPTEHISHIQVLFFFFQGKTGSNFKWKLTKHIQQEYMLLHVLLGVLLIKLWQYNIFHSVEYQLQTNWLKKDPSTLKLVYQEELATVKIVSSEVQVCFWSQLGLPTVLPPKSLLPLLLCPESCHERDRLAVICKSKNTIPYIKDLMLILKLMLLCLKRSFLLNHIFNIFYFIGYIKKEKKNCWLKLLFNFTCSKTNEFMREFGATIGMKCWQEILPD